MKERVISALIMLPMLILLILQGIPIYLGGVVLMGIALHEFYEAFQSKGYKPAAIIGYLFTAYIFFANLFHLDMRITGFAVFVLFILAIVLVLSHRINPIDVCITFASLGYVCMFFEFVIMTIDKIDRGYILVWLIFLISFATDIFAYLVGRQFGKHKLIPTVSPKKTIEGSLGGIIASLIISLIFGLVFKFSIGPMIFVGIFGSVIAQLGDLTASSIKRYVGIKDFGKLIPGHGGILDRFDSVLLVAPFIYFIFSIFVN